MNFSELKYNLYELEQAHFEPLSKTIYSVCSDEALPPDLNAKDIIRCSFVAAADEIGSTQIGWGTAGIVIGLIGTFFIPMIKNDATGWFQNLSNRISVPEALLAEYASFGLALFSLKLLGAGIAQVRLPRRQTKEGNFYALNAKADGDKTVYARAERKINDLVVRVYSHPAL